MSRVDDLSHQEIADRLDLSVNTVKCQIMNALKKIQLELKNMMIVCIGIAGSL
jgi:DNA-directed RNA polymerase specialized sigma24 family protein